MPAVSLVLLTSQPLELRAGNASVHVSAETALEFTELLIKGMHHETVSFTAWMSLSLHFSGFLSLYFILFIE